MSIIQERIRPLALPESDCAPLDKRQLDELLSMVKPLVTVESSSLVTEMLSIADLPPEAVTAKLKSFGVRDQTVFVCWPAFREGFKIKWEVFTARFDDFWYPSSDDVIVTSPAASWAMEITHEETVRFFRLDNPNRQEKRSGDLPLIK